MAARLAPIPWAELVRKLRELGFEGPYRGGAHPYMVRGDRVVAIPNPHRGDISPALLSRILRQAGVSRREWLGESSKTEGRKASG